MGAKEVKERFEVDSPEQVIDYLGMMGDWLIIFLDYQGLGIKLQKNL